MSTIAGFWGKISHLDAYFEAAEKSYKTAIAEPTYTNRLIYAATIMMYWEAAMNSWIIDCLEKDAPPKYKDHLIDRLTWMKAEDKLVKLPSILTEGQLKTKKKHPFCISILEMVGIRNALMHRKDHYKNLPATIMDEEKGISETTLSTADPNFEKLSPKKITEYREAIYEFVSSTYTQFRMTGQIYACSFLLSA